MIKANKGHVRIEGRPDTVLAELSCICKILLENGFTTEELEDAVELAKCDDLEETFIEEMEEMLDDLFARAIKGIIEDIEGRKDE